jgi:hypothetical protein
MIQHCKITDKITDVKISFRFLSVKYENLNMCFHLEFPALKFGALRI